MSKWIVELSCDCSSSSVYYGPFDSKESAEEFGNMSPSKYMDVHEIRDPRDIEAGLRKLLGYKVEP